GRMEDKSASLSQDESLFDSGNAGAGIIVGPSGAATRSPILPMEKPRAPWLQPHMRNFPPWQCVGCRSAAERKAFPYTGDSWQKPGRAPGGTGPCEFAARAQHALGRN